MKNSTVKTIHIDQDFIALDNRTLDSKKRITLGTIWFDKTVQPIRSFQVYQNKDGDILLRPEVSIPAREAWVYENPKAFASLQRGIQDAAAGKGKVVDDLKSFINKL
jgi:hypothetical protein